MSNRQQPSVINWKLRYIALKPSRFLTNCWPTLLLHEPVSHFMLTIEFIMCDIRILHITKTFFGMNGMVGLFVV